MSDLDEKPAISDHRMRDIGMGDIRTRMQNWIDHPRLSSGPQLMRQGMEEIGRLRAECSEYRQMFQHALSHVDAVFQKCQEIPEPILPGYARPGEDKFAAVVRLAGDYLKCLRLLRWLLDNMSDGWLPELHRTDEWVMQAAKAAGGDDE